MQRSNRILAICALVPLAALAFPDGPEPGHTGGAGQQDCSACHYAGPAKTGNSGIELRGLAEAMVPGDTYSFELIVRDPQQQAGGFQLAIRYNEGSEQGTSAGAIRAGEGLRTVTADNILYLSHDTPQVAVDESGERETRWRFKWTAPETTNAVELAVAAVAANDDNSALGDNVYKLKRVIAVEQAPSSEPAQD